jgi:Protein of unknown function (DUF2934)
VSKPKIQPRQQPVPSEQSAPLSHEAIQARAYQIYESRNRTDNHADEDWSQAQTELMELVSGK